MLFELKLASMYAHRTLKTNQHLSRKQLVAYNFIEKRIVVQSVRLSAVMYDYYIEIIMNRVTTNCI